VRIIIACRAIFPDTGPRLLTGLRQSPPDRAGGTAVPWQDERAVIHVPGLPSSAGDPTREAYPKRTYHVSGDSYKKTGRPGRDLNPGQKLRRLLGCPLPYRDHAIHVLPAAHPSRVQDPGTGTKAMAEGHVFHINSTLFSDKYLDDGLKSGETAGDWPYSIDLPPSGDDPFRITGRVISRDPLYRACPGFFRDS
jgi:hypothetical protein